MLCLGIETSCDETALALVRDGTPVDSILASSSEVHAVFGGVVPEIASREHYHCIGKLYDILLDKNGILLNNIDAICVTRGPGLLGALLVGSAFAKGLAFSSSLPLIGVNHLHAHLIAATIGNDVKYPALGLLVSGGHTHTYFIESPIKFHLLGKTLDDAAGEAFDKFAKMLGLPYPGGAMIDKIAKQGIPDKKLFPRPNIHAESMDFSFSGLKTAASRWLALNPDCVECGNSIRKEGNLDKATQKMRNLCASYVCCIAETLRIKVEYAIKSLMPNTPRSLLLAGGVAANSFVREEMRELSFKYSIPLFVPDHKLCTDNGVMVAVMGWHMIKAGMRHPLSMSSIPRGQKIPNDAIYTHF